MSDPRAQESYQIRFDWGLEGMAALASADLRVLVDACSAPSSGTSDLIVASIDDAPVVAAEVLRRQADGSDRISVAVIAVGHELRAPVDDLLLAGAVIEALAEAGLDHCSPEAAAAGAAFAGLRGGLHHLLAASVRGRLARESRAAS